MKKIIALLMVAILFSCQPESSKTTYEARDYSVYIQGNLAGKHSSRLDSDGNYVFTYAFNDRGRGPELTEKIILHTNGAIQQMEISGVNYLKDTISEVFNYEDGTAIWKSTSEKGEASSDANAFYSSVNGTLGDWELLIRKMLSSQNQSVDLLPSGSARISDIDSVEIGGIPLKLVAVTGFGFVPSHLWLDQDDRIFASISSWISIIGNEHESMVDELMAFQTEKEDAYFEALAKGLTEIPSSNLVIKNTNLFDAHSGNILPNQTIAVNGNSIVAVLDGNDEIPDDALIIDGAKKTLMPGLFDNHCHVQKEDGLLHLAAGVTSVRDMANSRELLEIKKQFDANTNIGPRIVTLAGFIDQKGPFAGPGLTISNVEEGKKAIEDYQKDGYQQIKLYSSINPDWVKPLAARAHELGLKLSGHIPAHMLAEEAIKDGYDEIQHVNMLVLNFLSDTIDTRTPLRFSAVAEHAQALDLKGKEFQDFVQLLKEREIEIDPTVSIFEGMFTTKAGQPDPQFEAILDRLPIQVQRSYLSGGLPIPNGMEQQYKDSFTKLLDILLELHESGVTLLPGTDAMPGFALHKELENYVKAGIPAKEVLQLATLKSAEVIGVDDQLGSIEKGKLADFILIDGNPVENISDIRRVELTIKNGKVYRPKELYSALGIRHFK
ncbi:MAG: amidohydrolase family protein [Bacteroidota bacterium]